MVWIRIYKQKKLISKISADSDLTFSSYAWLGKKKKTSLFPVGGQKT